MSFEFAGKPIKCRAAVAWEAGKPLCKLIFFNNFPTNFGSLFLYLNKT